MKKILITGATAMVILAAASPSGADDDALGAQMLKCFHSGDRHMDTSCERLADNDDVDAKKAACDGTSFKALGCNTSYRGGWTNASYSMRTEVSMKYTCEKKSDGSVKMKSWMKILNVRDSKTPEECELESWRVVGTSTKH